MQVKSKVRSSMATLAIAAILAFGCAFFATSLPRIVPDNPITPAFTPFTPAPMLVSLEGEDEGTASNDRPPDEQKPEEEQQPEEEQPPEEETPPETPPENTPDITPETPPETTPEVTPPERPVIVPPINVNPDDENQPQRKPDSSGGEGSGTIPTDPDQGKTEPGDETPADESYAIIDNDLAYLASLEYVTDGTRYADGRIAVSGDVVSFNVRPRNAQKATVRVFMIGSDGSEVQIAGSEDAGWSSTLFSGENIFIARSYDKETGEAKLQTQQFTIFFKENPSAKYEYETNVRAIDYNRTHIVVTSGETYSGGASVDEEGNLTFMARPEYPDAVDFVVTFNDTPISPIAGDTYQVQLTTGRSNRIHIACTDRATGLTASGDYLINYRENDPSKAPIITTNLDGGPASTSGTPFRFEITSATDSEGEPLYRNNIEVTIEGVPGASATWVAGDSMQFQYDLHLLPPLEGDEVDYTVHVRADDGKGSPVLYRDYTIHYTFTDEGNDIGSVYVGINLSVLGLGTVMGANVELKQGDSLQDVVDRAFEPYGYTALWSGDYLSGISGGGIGAGAYIPDTLRKKIEEDGLSFGGAAYDTIRDHDWVVEGSGWMYMVNGSAPTSNIGSFTPSSGDSVILIYTLAWGKDLGMSSGFGSLSTYCGSWMYGYVENHVHYTYKTFREPTCTEEGLEGYVCDVCGAVSSEPTAAADGEHKTIPALGHDWSTAGQEYAPPTEIEEGYQVYKCTRCNETKTEIIPPTGGGSGSGGSPDPSGGSPDPSGGSPDPSGGSPDPSGGSPDPSGGSPDPSGGSPDPSGGSPDPSGGSPDPGGGSSGGDPDPGSGTGGDPDPGSGSGGDPDPGGGSGGGSGGTSDPTPGGGSSSGGSEGSGSGGTSSGNSTNPGGSSGN